MILSFCTLSCTDVWSWKRRYFWCWLKNRSGIHIVNGCHVVSNCQHLSSMFSWHLDIVTTLSAMGDREKTPQHLVLFRWAGPRFCCAWGVVRFDCLSPCQPASLSMCPNKGIGGMGGDLYMFPTLCLQLPLRLIAILFVRFFCLWPCIVGSAALIFCLSNSSFCKLLKILFIGWPGNFYISPGSYPILWQATDTANIFNLWK